MKLKTLSLLATASAVACGAFASGAQAATIGGFGARPAHFNPNVPATRAYFIRTVPRGGSFTDQVVVTNTAAKPVTLRVYPVDGLTGATSGVVYGNRGVALHGAGQWVTPAVAVVTVPANSQTRSASPSRSRRARLSASISPDLRSRMSAPGKSRGRFSVTEVLRTVVGIEVTVPGPSQSRLVSRELLDRPDSGHDVSVGGGQSFQYRYKPV